MSGISERKTAREQKNYDHTLSEWESSPEMCEAKQEPSLEGKVMSNTFKVLKFRLRADGCPSSLISIA